MFGGAGPAALRSDTERGIEFYNNGDTQQALSVLVKATKQNPNDADAWHFLGLSYFKLLKNKDARKAFERSIKIRPEFAPAHVSLAYLDLHENKLAEARKEAQTGLTLDSKDGAAHFVLASEDFSELGRISLDLVRVLHCIDDAARAKRTGATSRYQNRHKAFSSWEHR